MRGEKSWLPRQEPAYRTTPGEKSGDGSCGDDNCI